MPGEGLHRSPGRPETRTWTKQHCPEIDEGKIHIQAFLPSRTWNETYYGHAIKVRWGFRAAFACAHCMLYFELCKVQTGIR